MGNTLDQKLRTAVLKGRVDDVRILLDDQDHVAKYLQAQDWWDGSTVLHHAARRGNVKMIELLLQRGANPNAIDYAGHTPLHFATQDHDVPSTIQLLLEMGRANVNQKSTLSGNTALAYASQAGFTDSACLLLDHDADLYGKNKQGLNAMDMARNAHVKTILYKCHLLHLTRQKLNIHMQLHVQKHTQDAATIQELQQSVQSERSRVLELQRLVSLKHESILDMYDKLDMMYQVHFFLMVMNLVVIPILSIILCYYRRQAMKNTTKNTVANGSARF